ncbi:MAG TPA: M23 family metallopeptidase, partial [Mycobacteriales bacterium]|nr:M23 family metallopeptidase [Mycobacteriales bacterium]
VSFAGVIGDVGVVAVRHADGLETTYEPVGATVREGMRVQAGATLGTVVTKGGHCAPATCLHWGLRRGSAYLDPLSLVGSGQVRLLPMMSGAGRASWLAPAAGGASIGSSAVFVGWAVTVTRRRRKPLPPGVACLATARAHREGSAHERGAG